MNNGGYDAGYRACLCFWGQEPSSYVVQLMNQLGDIRGWRVLDLGCGEGKNGMFLARKGAQVLGVDVSPFAIGNARATRGTDVALTLVVGDAGALRLGMDRFDIIIAYGLLHCLANECEARDLVAGMQAATKRGGFNVVCCFNDGRQDLAAAHPGFEPLLLAHDALVDLYRGWRLLAVSNSILRETHPHNGVEHEHSLTRLIALKES